MPTGATSSPHRVTPRFAIFDFIFTCSTLELSNSALHDGSRCGARVA